jgi:NAD(P)-dependent dehydrogenase (short-subunit alcohol dehydrogenase family)
MKIDLSGKRAVVTGSTSGIGFAITRGLAEAGAAVVINGCSQKNIDGATRRLHEHVPQAKWERYFRNYRPDSDAPSRREAISMRKKEA